MLSHPRYSKGQITDVTDNWIATERLPMNNRRRDGEKFRGVCGWPHGWSPIHQDVLDAEG
jgi:hypothetical protein